jgi:hypothetical protein
MATGGLDDLQTEAPPAKRARLEEFEDDLDDIYSTGQNTPAQDASPKPEVEAMTQPIIEASNPPSSGIPGLGLLCQSPNVVQPPLPEGMS